MDYIIFLATIQIPFVYLVWRMFRSHGSRLERDSRERLRDMDSRQRRVSHLVDIFKMTLEKSQAELAARIENLEGRVTELEKYTGLRAEAAAETAAWPAEAAAAPPLRDKNFL